MAASPDWKLYDRDGNYNASAWDPVLLAACIGILGDGATIRYRHLFTAWTEGKDGEASESYDKVAEKCFAEVRARTDRWHGIHRTPAAKERYERHIESEYAKTRAEREARDARRASS